MITTELQRKIDGSIRLLRTIQKAHEGEQIEIAYSGGNDSDVILQLAKEAGINYRAIYKNTTIDPPGTLAHVRAMGVEVMQPKRSFIEIVKAKGLPNRQHRFCCSELKEYKVLDVCVMGIRREESSKRAARYKEPTECRFYGSKRVHAEAVYPILDWTLDDVREFIFDRNITLAPVYYDKHGKLHVERRLGCIGCPLANRAQRIEEYKNYPKLLRATIKAVRVFRETHPNAASITKYNQRDEYEQMVRDIFFDNQDEYNIAVNGGLFGDTERVDCKAFLEKYFNVKL